MSGAASNQPTLDRDRVRALIDSGEIESAIGIAEHIEDPWFKCQALTFAARGISDPETRRQLTLDAFAVARIQSEPNRIVSVSAWPLRLLAESGDETAVADHLTVLLGIIRTEPNPTRRADGIVKLARALARGPVPELLRTVDALLETAKVWSGKRTDSALRELAPVILPLDQGRAREMVSSIKKEGLREKASAELERGVIRGMDDILWVDDYSFGTRG